MPDVPNRVTITMPDGWAGELIHAIRDRESAAHAFARELWGYDPADVPASRVVVDVMILGLRQVQLEIDAESYHAAAQDAERRDGVAFLAANLFAIVAAAESQS